MIWVGVLDEPCVVTDSDGPVPAAGVLSTSPNLDVDLGLNKEQQQ